jgi:hypothetical protein
MGVLSIVQKVGTPFFLTGGTALSRYYTHHRYSDDLDFFVAGDPNYSGYVDAILKELIESEARNHPLQKSFNWRDIVAEAKSKEVGADPEIFYEILMSFPLKSLNSIKWITPPDAGTFRTHLEIIASDILYGRMNSLSRK